MRLAWRWVGLGIWIQAAIGFFQRCGIFGGLFRQHPIQLLFGMCGAGCSCCFYGELGGLEVEYSLEEVVADGGAVVCFGDVV